MPKVGSLKDGYWNDTGVFPAASQPSASLGCTINHNVMIQPMTSSFVTSSIAFGSANGVPGQIGVSGPKSFITVGAVKYRLGAVGIVEENSTTSHTPYGTRG